MYEELKEFDGKDYYKMMFKFIDAYDKYIKDNIFQKEEKEFLEMLFSNGIDFLNMQFSDMEGNIRKELDNKNLINEEIKNLKNQNNNEINLLINQQEENENYKNIFNDDKNKQKLLLNSYKEYDNEEIKIFLNYIIEFWEILGGNKNKKKQIKNVEDNEDMMFYCNDVLKMLEQKENLINKYINDIENVFINGDNNNIILIEKIIYNRKKIGYKQEQAEIRRIKEENEIKKKLKTIEEYKIVLKGRKVIQDFPLIKKNKKKNKVVLKKNNDDYDYLYYSSDEN